MKGILKSRPVTPDVSASVGEKSKVSHSMKISFNGAMVAIFKLFRKIVKGVSFNGNLATGAK